MSDGKKPILLVAACALIDSDGDGALELIGAEADAWATITADPRARLHLYGKAESRPGRKMGHVNRVGG